MQFEIHGHRHGDVILTTLEPYHTLWLEICNALDEITDDDIIDEFEQESREAKSISQALNRLIKRELVKRGWHPESYIFADEEYAERAKGVWRLDFAKGPICVEVAFNHRSDISWNLIKPTLASELNHVIKAIQADGGIIITATQAMKAAGGFDNAVGTFEDYVQYLKPLSTILTAPLIVVGLEAPETFDIVHESKGNKKVGHVRRFEG